MATMAEKTMSGIQKEVEKLQKRIERLNAKREKNMAKAVKLGCAEWTREEWMAKREILAERARNAGKIFMEYDESILSQKQDSVMWDLMDDIERDDAEHRLANAQARLAKATEKYYVAEAEVADKASIEKKETSWLGMTSMMADEQLKANAKERERRYQEWLAQFKAECLLDGVAIDTASNNRVTGTTKSGKRFCMDRNSGFTMRHFHCYTLYLDGDVVFTSGTFATCYAVVRR